MKLRSKTREEQDALFDELKSELMDMGMYEEDMSFHEMNQLKAVLNESSALNAEATYESDLERALRESEMVFDISHLMSSTVNGESNSKYEFPSETSDVVGPLTVHAVVHHELDWDPSESPRVSAPRKRRAVEPLMGAGDGSETNGEHPKRQHMDEGDSGYDDMAVDEPLVSAPRKRRQVDYMEDIYAIHVMNED